VPAVIGGIVSISDSNRAPMEEDDGVVDCDDDDNEENNEDAVESSAATDIFVPPKMKTVATGSIKQFAICRRLIFSAVV
jgi:hypothetical protein